MASPGTRNYGNRSVLDGYTLSGAKIVGEVEGSFGREKIVGSFK